MTGNSTCSEFSREAPDPSASAVGERFRFRLKYEKPPNTGCISGFSYCKAGPEDPHTAADDRFRVSLLRLHRIIRQGSSARDFVPVQSFKNVGILYVFPVFGTAEMVQKIR